MAVKLSNMPDKQKPGSIDHLEQLRQSEGWQILVANLQANIDVINNDLDEPEGKADDPVQYKVNDLVQRAKKKHLQELMRLPETLIAIIRKHGDSKEPSMSDHDPYE